RRRGVVGPPGGAGRMSEKKFRFRLATVLRVARVKEDQQRAQLAARQRAAAEAERAEAERQAAYEARPADQPGSASEFEATRSIVDLRARAVQDARANRLEAEAEMARARGEWM